MASGMCAHDELGYSRGHWRCAACGQKVERDQAYDKKHLFEKAWAVLHEMRRNEGVRTTVDDLARITLVIALATEMLQRHGIYTDAAVKAAVRNDEGEVARLVEENRAQRRAAHTHWTSAWDSEKQTR